MVRLQTMLIAVWSALVAASAAHASHPRIFFDAADITNLHTRAATTHASIASQLRAFADHMVTAMPDPPTDPVAEFPDEGTWRIWGEHLTPVAMAWLIEPEQTRRDAYMSWMLLWLDAMASWPQWGPTLDTHLDLDGAHLLAGFAVTCDIIDGELDDTRRALYHVRIATHATAVANAIANDPPWWTHNWLGNHNTINHHALLTAGLMLEGEHADAASWITVAADNTQHVMELRTNRTDGSDLEGVMYATYGDHSLFQSLFLLDRHRDISYADSPWLAARTDFYLHGAHSGLDEVLGIGDGLGTWGHGPEQNLFYLDSIVGDGRATALALAIQNAMADTHPLGKPAGATLWLSFLWFDSSLADSAFPGDSPSLHYFDDWDVVTFHEGWDEGDTVLSFKCGVPPGRSAWNAMLENPTLVDDLGCSHANPDAGSFTFLPGGRHFILDSLYERPKRTSVNNCITFGPPPVIDRGFSDADLATVWDLAWFDQLGNLLEIGQRGEWNVWMGPMAYLLDPADDTSVTAQGTDAGVVYASGEASGAYPASIHVEGDGMVPLGLQRLHRGLLLLPGDVLLVVDRIVTDGSMPTHTYFRSLATPTFDRQFAVTTTGGTLVLDDGSSGMIDVLTPFTGTIDAGRTVTDWDNVHPALHVTHWSDLGHWSVYLRFTNADQDDDVTNVYLLRASDATAQVTQIDTSDSRGVRLTIALASGVTDVRIATDLSLHARLGFLGLDAYATCRGGLHADVCNGSVCPCTGDLDGDGVVDVDDMLAMLGDWGLSGASDIDGSGIVNIDDLMLLFARWGPC